MDSLERWKEIAYRHLSEEEKTAKQRELELYKEELEKEERRKRIVVADLFLAENEQDRKQLLHELDERKLRETHHQLERLKSKIEARYTALMDEMVFQRSKRTLKELIVSNDWLKVRDFMEGRGMENMDSFEKVYRNLQQLEPLENDDGAVLVLREEENGTFQIAVKHPNDMEEYSYDFQPWERWLGAYVSDEGLRSHGELVFLEACLWEMTFDGYDQEQIQERASEVERRIKESESER